jgi:hypothetical protein
MIYSPKKPFVQAHGNGELARLDPYINRLYVQ